MTLRPLASVPWTFPAVPPAAGVARPHAIVAIPRPRGRGAATVFRTDTMAIPDAVEAAARDGIRRFASTWR